MKELSFTWQSGGFGLPCKRCGSKDAENELHDGELPKLSGVFCDACCKIVTEEAVAYYRRKLKEAAKKLKSTVLFRQGGTWTAEEKAGLSTLKGGVWTHAKHPEYMILQGHVSGRAISKALPGAAPYNVTKVIGTNRRKLPFQPF